jgi:hypothetical protein
MEFDGTSRASILQKHQFPFSIGDKYTIIRNGLCIYLYEVLQI